MFKVLEFWAVWCDPCKRQAPGVAEAREKFGDYMTFERINVDEDVETSNKYGVRSLPTLIVLDQDNKEVSRKTGAMDKYKLFEWIASLY